MPGVGLAIQNFDSWAQKNEWVACPTRGRQGRSPFKSLSGALLRGAGEGTRPYVSRAGVDTV